MLKLGLTGGIACGKSTVGAMMVARGAHLLQADQVAHRLMEPGEPVYQEVVRRFGRGILQPDGAIDRARLAEAAFGSGRIQELNHLVHPAVLERQEQWMAEIGVREPGAIVVVEAALILEAGARAQFDRLIVVTCRAEQKAARFAERQKLDLAAARKEVERRAAAQWPDEKKAAAADYVIDNSGSRSETERQVDALFAELKRLASEAQPAKNESLGSF